MLPDIMFQGLNAALFYDNTNPKEYISLVPTSAHSGDGMGNLIALLCHYSQTYLAKRVAVTDNLQCTVMEVKALPGLGTCALIPNHSMTQMWCIVLFSCLVVRELSEFIHCTYDSI